MALAAVVASAGVPARAHVTVQPPEAKAGSFARFVVRVPNERDNAATTKVEVQLPPGLEHVSFQPKAGWARAVSGTTVTWEGGRIEPGEFDEFGFSARMPEQPGTLEFPAVQTYSSGEVVRWIGPADADEPAGRVTVIAAEAEGVDDDEDDDEESDVDVVLGGIGVGLGAVALLVALTRRRPTA